MNKYPNKTRFFHFFSILLLAACTNGSLRAAQVPSDGFEQVERATTPEKPPRSWLGDVKSFWGSLKERFGISKAQDDDSKSEPDSMEQGPERPQCWERVLAELTGLTRDIQVVRQPAETQRGVGIFHEGLQELQTALEAEGLYTPEIAKLCEALQDQVRAEAWPNVETHLQQIASKLHHFDTQKMFSLIRDSQKAIDKVSGQDVYVLIGETGAGKSTTTLFLAGVPLENVTDDSNPENPVTHVAPPEKLTTEYLKARGLDPALQEVTVSWKPVSETQKVTSVKIEVTNPTLRYQIGAKSMIVCDVPGFGDTGGAEVATAHAFNLRKMVHKCRSVRFIVLVSANKIGDRFQGIENLVRFLSDMIDGVEENKASISYFFTKFSEEAKSNLHGKLQATITKKIDEKEQGKPIDDSFMQLLFHIDEKMQAHLKNMTFHPLQTNREEVLGMLAKSHPIKEPHRIFKLAVMPEARGRIEAQVAQYKESIHIALQHGRYDLVDHRLSQIKQLGELFEWDDLKSTYAHCVEQVVHTMNQAHEQACGQLHRCLQGEKLTREAVEEYGHAFSQACQGAPLVQHHLQGKAIGHEAYMTELNKEIRNIVASLQGAASSGKGLGMLRVIADVFEEGLEPYEKCVADIQHQIAVQIAKAKEAVAQNDFRQLASQMNALEKAIGQVQGHIPTCQEEYEKLKQHFVAHLHQLREEVVGKVAEGENLQAQDIELVKQPMFLLGEAKAVAALEPYFEEGCIAAIHKEALDRLLERFEQSAATIEQGLESQEGNTFLAMEEPFALLEAIYRVPGVETHASDRYYQTIEKLRGCIRHLEGKSCQNLRQGLKVGDTEMLQSCTHFLETLITAPWINNFCEGDGGKVLQHAIKEVKIHVHTMQQNIKALWLDWGRYEDMQELSRILSTTPNIRVLEKVLPEVGGQLEEIKKEAQASIQPLFAEIGQWVPPKELPIEIQPWKYQQAIIFLGECRKFGVEKHEARRLIIGLQKNIEDYGQHMQRTMCESLDTVDDILSNPQGDVTAILPKWNGALGRVAASVESMRQLKSDASKVWTCFHGDPLRDPLRRMEHSADEATMFFRALGSHELRQWLPLLRGMRKWDAVLGSEADKQFANLYRELKHKIGDHMAGVIQRIEDLIKSNDHILLTPELEKVDDIQKGGLQLNLYASLTSLEQDARRKAQRLANNINIELVDEITEKLRQLKAAEHHVFWFLREEQRGVLQTSIKEVEAIVSRHLDSYLEGIDTLLHAHQFVEAEKGIRSIREVSAFLQGVGPDRVQQYVKNFNKKVEKVFEEQILNKYKEAELKDLQDIIPNTKKIFEQLVKAKKKNIQYTGFKEALEKVIFQKFQSAYQEMEGLLKPSNKGDAKPNLHQIKKRLKALETNMQEALRCLPKEYCSLYSQIEERINKIIKNRKQAEERAKEELERVLESNNFREMRKLLEAQKEEGVLFSAEQEITRCVQNLFHANAQVVNLAFCTEDPEAVFKLAPAMLKNLLECDFEFGYYLTNIGSETTKFQKKFDSTIQGVVEKLTHLLSTLGDATKLEQQFGYLTSASKLRRNVHAHCEHPSMARRLFSSSLEASLECGYKEVAQAFEQQQTAFEQGRAKRDANLLQTSLDRAKCWEPFLQSLDASLQEVAQEGKSVEKARRKLLTYGAMVKAVQQDLTQQVQEIAALNLLNKRTKEEAQRQDFYQEVSDRLEYLQLFSSLDDHCKASPYYQKAQSVLENKLGALVAPFQKDLQDIADLDQGSKVYAALNMIGRNVSDFAKCVADPKLKAKAKTMQSRLETYLKNHIQQRCEEAKKAIGDPEAFCHALVWIKVLSQAFPSRKQEVDKEIDQLLKSYTKKNGGPVSVAGLGQLLQAEESGTGRIIIAEHKQLKGYKIFQRNVATQRHGIDYVLEHLEGHCLDKEELAHKYQAFDKLYWQYLDKYLKKNMDLSSLVAEIKSAKAAVSLNRGGKLDWDRTKKEKALRLMAGVFAWWTLSQAEHYFDAAGLVEQRSYLVQPHAAQVISIMRMLNLDGGSSRGKSFWAGLRGKVWDYVLGEDEKNGLVNNFVAIGTGEGKTITLAVTGTVLALMGCDISCACYSSYLSERDYASCKPMFNAFGVTEQIHYGTFQKLCEREINEKGDVRHMVHDAITRQQVQLAQKRRNRPKILLIDEVDVFFDESFYGNAYRPSLPLHHPTIQALAAFIWNSRGNKLTLHALKQSAEYQACCQQFPGWEELIAEAAKSMMVDVLDFQSPAYFVDNDKIAYTDHGVSSNLVYGYSTLFAYFHEHEQGNITQQRRDEHTCLYINCGNFSYAEMPFRFHVVMGVTGTLGDLTRAERHIVAEDYHIRKMTFAPSVFGANNLEFKEEADINIENRDDYFNRIHREIIERRDARAPAKRSVMVFFEDEKQLNIFRDAPCMHELRGELQIMHERLTPQEKEQYVAKATRAGQITLSTPYYGRGTDFVCYDKEVANNGGPHVLQTFLSEKTAEQRQIQGRTARQSGQGSYSMVLKQDDLEKFGLFEPDIKRIRNQGIMFQTLNEQREIFSEKKYEDRKEVVNQAKALHQESKEFLTSLRKGDKDFAKSYLCKINAGPPVKASSRTIVLMDATGSMSSLLEKCKATLRIMFGRAVEVLHDHGIAEDSFEMQLAVYRNYNCDEHALLESSGWENKPENLCTFMNRISVQGGMGNEAIEIGLWHVNQEAAKRDDLEFQCILIGDMPPNTKQEVGGKRERKGGSYWGGTRFALPTYYEDELQGMIKSRNIPIHAFFVRSSARNKFQEIAQATGGRCEELNINSPQGGERLTGLVTEEILRKAGGAQGDQLVEAYREKYAMYAA